MPVTVTYLPILIAILITWLGLELLLRLPLPKRVLAFPNERSMHSTPVPRIGGIAMVLALVLAWLFLMDSLPSLRSLGLAISILAALSLIDDLRELPALLRLLTHLAVASVFVLSQLSVPFLAAFIISFALTWMMSLYNFMDGLDGLAAGMAITGFGAYSLMAFYKGNTSFAIASLCIVITALVFLRYNFSPARIFMGDVASVPLGASAGMMALLGWQQGIWPLWYPCFVFAPFIIDASLTLAKRLLQGHKPWQAHREHYYQRLARMSSGHELSVLSYYAFMLAIACAAFSVLVWGTLLAMTSLVLVLLLFIAFLLYIDYRWARYQA